MLAACWLVARKLSRVRTLRQRQSASREGLLACAVPGFSALLQTGDSHPAPKAAQISAACSTVPLPPQCL